MSDSDQLSTHLAYRTSDEILAHPRFERARIAFVDAILGLYEGDVFLTRLLLEAARQVIFNMIIHLHALYDEADRSTWPTIARLKEEMVRFGLASPRRIEALVARLIHNGLLESAPSKQDRRVRILMPTERMLELDRDWLAATHLPLQVMFPDPGYDLVMGKDPSFQRAQRLVAKDFHGRGAEILSSNPGIMVFMSRDAGMMILIKLAQAARDAGKSAAEGLTYADIGARFGVSRTHVRKVLADAESAGLVHLSGRGGERVQLTPAVMRVLDRFIADAMSGHDLLYKIALGRMSTQRSA
jgi:DNA-binding MarR family transcriptional regulator